MNNIRTFLDMDGWTTTVTPVHGVRAAILSTVKYGGPVQERCPFWFWATIVKAVQCCTRKEPLFSYSVY